MKSAVKQVLTQPLSGRSLLASALMLAGAQATAGDLVFGDLTSGLGEGYRYQAGPLAITAKGQLAVGGLWRADDQDERLGSSAYGMDTLNDGELNYERGDAVSGGVVSYWQVEAAYDNLGLVASTNAWYDDVQKNSPVKHGSVANGYEENEPLSDDGFVERGKFSNVVLNDAYLYGRFQPAGRDLLVRVGNQTIPWKTPTSIKGGLQKVNAFDYPSKYRAGSAAESATVPMPAVYADLKISDNLSVDAFSQFGFEPNVYPGCGTIYSTSDFGQEGCDKLTLNGSVLSALTSSNIETTDAQAISNPLDYVARGADEKPDDNQYGMSLRYLLDNVGLFGFYFADYTSRSALTQVTHVSAGVLTPVAANLGLATPDGLAITYERVYPTHIRMYGMNFQTRLPVGTGIYAEYTYRPNQPVRWNGADFVTGLLAGQGPLAYLAGTDAGYVAKGYDRFQISQLNLGASHPLTEQTKLGVEAGFKYVANLPDTDERRYGRLGFGVPDDGSGTCTGSKRQCAMDGFVTDLSWGLRARLSGHYSGLIAGVEWEPSLALAYDVKGYSYYGEFSEGDLNAIAAVKALYKKDYEFNLKYLHTGGSDYNVVADRSLISASAGVRF
ncbi:DUF1302 domain-containing protein [Thalassolituus sp. LLYu03]|uniref:DUF1302 domain-containing protein n=1 Tax=Thalassolituus sp. LLYu03 TaxID=3421656 RepID=UPI003D2691DF